MTTAVVKASKLLTTIALASTDRISKTQRPMFPQSFNARVAERMAIWGAMLGFLLFLYAATELIQSRQAAEIADERQRATGAAMAHVIGDASKFASEANRIEAGKKSIEA